MTILEELDLLENFFLDPGVKERTKIKELYWSIVYKLSEEKRKVLSLLMWDAMVKLVADDNEEDFKKTLQEVRRQLTLN